MARVRTDGAGADGEGAGGAAREDSDRFGGGDDGVAGGGRDGVATDKRHQAPRARRRQAPRGERIADWADGRLGIYGLAKSNMRKIFPDHWS
ncbi:hypothetical protein ABZ822_31770, partial [Streptomyces sp. NPDC047108]